MLDIIEHCILCLIAGECILVSHDIRESKNVDVLRRRKEKRPRRLQKGLVRGGASHEAFLSKSGVKSQRPFLSPV